MSDDFDKDDLPWLPDDDEQSDDDHDDEEEFDWQQSGDDGEQKAPPGGHLGFTTELPWMQDEVTGPDATKDDDDDFSWQTDEAADDSDDDDDTLSWQDAPAADAEDADSLAETLLDDDLGDLGAVSAPPDLDLGDVDEVGDLGASASPAMDPDSVPDWLESGPSPDMGNLEDTASTAEEPAEDAGALPDWLGSTPAEFATSDDPPESTAQSDRPDWLPSSTPEDDLTDLGAVDSTPEASEPQRDVPDWLQASTTEVDDETPTTTAPTSTPIEEVPDWLNETTGEPPAAPADEIDISAGPDWLQAADEPDPVNDVPDWLAGDAPAADSGMVDETGGLSDDWLASGAELPDAAESDQSYDEWFQAQQAASRPRDLEELVPDFDQLASTDEDEGGSGEVPDWFLGMEELDTTDAPEWFTGETPATDNLTPNAGDWLSDDAAPDSSELDDFFAGLEEQSPAEGLGEDFFANLETPEVASPAGEFDDLDPAADSSQYDDFFASLGAGEDGALVDDMDVSETEAVEELDEDFFSNLGEPQSLILGEVPETSDDEFLSAVSEAEDDLDAESLDALFNADDLDSVPDGDLLSTLGIVEETQEEAEPEQDWFADEPAPDDLTAAGWLDDIEELDASELESALASIDDLPEMPADGLTDIDRLLAGYESADEQLPDTGSLLSEETDFDTLFSDPAFSDIDLAEADSDEIQPETPDWLTEAGATIGGPSAAAILRGREDRPLDQLPDRLQRLRDRSADKELKTGDEGLDAFAPDVSEVASATEVGMAGIAEDIRLTAQQTGQVDLLKQLTAGEQASVVAGRRRAISEDPFMRDEDDRLEGDVDALITAPRRSLLSRIKFTRLLIALLVAGAVIVPFVADIRIGDLPPTEFTLGSRQQNVFNALAGLEADDRVLVGMEYGPTGAAELDSAARVLFQHMLVQGVKPVVVSTNPVALLRANNMLTDLGRSDSPLLGIMGRNTPLRPNEDYYVARYLPANATSLRAFGINPGPQLALDLHGEPTQLTINGLRDFAQIVVIAERPDDLRAWAEQIVPLTNRPVLAATGLSAQPLIEPYIGPSISGLLVGYADALTYANLLSTDIDRQVIDPNATLPPTETLEPTPTPPVSEFGVIVSDQNINVRSGPGQSFEIVDSVAPGTDVLLLGTNDDGSWTNIALEDGTLGWILSDFLQIALDDEPTATMLPTETPAVTETTAPTEDITETVVPTETALPTDTPVPTATATVTATALPTDTPTATATPVPSDTPVPTAALDTQPIARVIATENVNVRNGPGTGFAPVGTASPGDEFVVLGRNADGSWIQIAYPGLVAGQEAWVAEFLLEIGVEPVDDASAARPARIVVAMAGSDFSGLFAQVEPTETVTPTIEIPPIAVEQSLPQAETRWYAMNLGLLVIIVVIIVGTLVNIARAILRRRA